jgi:adenine-specific DNA methylase
MEFLAITQKERRSLGRFDTPRPLAQALTDWAVQDAHETVLEPSCGGGVIVKSVISRKMELGAKYPTKGIWACDIDPRALAETARNIAPHTPKLILCNFLNATPSAFGNTKFDVILGNPPYVRLHTMDAATREIARKAIPASDLLGARASLWAYFPIHAFKMLAIGGRMGWILPEAILHVDYGKQILRWATQRFARCIAVSLRERCFVIDGAQERVVMLLLAGAGGQASRELEMIEFTTANECITAIPKLACPNSPDLPQLNGHAVPHLVSNFATTAAGIMETSDDLKKFGDFAGVKIGVVTGDNDFFLLSEQQRFLARLSTRHFQRIVSKFADLGEGFEFTGERDERSPELRLERSWLLCPNPRSGDSRLAKYLQKYSPEKITTNKTMGKRAHWQAPELGAVPDAFFQYMGKYGPKIVLNEAGHYCTNTIHRIFFAKRLSRAKRRAICLSLHSTYSQLSAEFEGRQYGSGVLKLEPSETRRLKFAFNESLIEALSSAWPKLKKDAVELGWESVVPKIDAIIVTHCPILAKSLPVEKVSSLLIKVRQRRNSIHIGVGT